MSYLPSNLASPQRLNKSFSSFTYSRKGSSPRSVGGFPDISANSIDLSESDNSDSEEEDVSAHDLLAVARGRLEQQKVMEDLRKAREALQEKDAEIEHLQLQLQIALSTKRDLVIVNQELEDQHEQDRQQLTEKEHDLKRTSMACQEVKAQVEKEFLNELAEMANKLEEAEKRRVQEVAQKNQTINMLKGKVAKMGELIQLAQRIEESEARLIEENREQEEIIRRLQEKVRRFEVEETIRQLELGQRTEAP
jgi:chromosome segregation protein